MRKVLLLLITCVAACTVGTTRGAAATGTTRAAAATGTTRATADDGRYVDTLAASHPEYLPEIAVGAEAPEISAPDTLGHVIRLSDYRGQYVAVDFWATWCGDCRRETPAFKRLYDDMKDATVNGARVQFLSYSFDRDASRWKSYVIKQGFTWPQVSTLQANWHDIPVTGAYGLHWIPAFLLITPDGKVAGKAITAEGLRQLLVDEAHGERD